MLTIPVLVHPKCEHIKRIGESIETVHRLQNYFRLSVTSASWLPHDGDEKRAVRPDPIRNRLRKKLDCQAAIAVIQNPFDTNNFSHEYRNATIISLANWEAEHAPPPLQVFLAYQFAGAMLNFAADLSDDMIDDWAHEEPIGCIFDDFEDKDMIMLGMVGANLCGECEVKFAGMGLPDAAREAVENVLSYVRSAAIRRPRTTASKVFIGHGRSRAWTQLRDFLEKHLGLSVDEFNQEPAAGVATTERLMTMLDQSCFALLVMTAEDEHADAQLHARQNVIHEVGLFQGRLGYRRAIIVKERNCAEFSNVHGLTYISFGKNRIKAAFPAIKKTLEREGIIPFAKSTSSNGRHSVRRSS